MQRLALSGVLFAIGCGDDDGGTESAGSNSASGSASVETSAETSAGSGDDAASNSASATGDTGSDSGDGSASADGSSGASAGSESGGDGMFPCGDRLTCLVATQYCEEIVGGAQGTRPMYRCLELPKTCAPDPSCDCLVGVGCGAMCQMSGDGLMVTCFAP